MNPYEALNKKFDELLIEVGHLRKNLEETKTAVLTIEKTLNRINKQYAAFSKRLNTAESDIQEINNPLGH